MGDWVCRQLGEIENEVELHWALIRKVGAKEKKGELLSEKS